LQRTHQIAFARNKGLFLVASVLFEVCLFRFAGANDRPFAATKEIRRAADCGEYCGVAGVSKSLVASRWRWQIKTQAQFAGFAHTYDDNADADRVISPDKTIAIDIKRSISIPYDGPAPS
jgi:hypothetical protein